MLTSVVETFWNIWTQKESTMMLENMIRLCDSLTPVETEIAIFITKNKDRVVDMTIQQLSDEIFVSKSAVHRFCRKIGIKGFNELKVKIVQDLSDLEKGKAVIDVNYPFEQRDSPKLIANKLMKLYETTVQDTFDYIDAEELGRISTLLYNAEVIDIYTHAHNLNPAESFQDKMLTIGRTVNCPTSFYTQRMTALAASQSHVAVIISYSGLASFILPILQKLYEKKIAVVFIGKAGSNLYPQYVTHYLSISDKENLRDRISQFSSNIALQYMLDVLFACIYNKNRKENIEYLHESIDFMDDRTID
jgi:DNA-binding MurR/RpiR family transcriptional regulator